MVPWGGFLHSDTQAKALEKEEGGTTVRDAFSEARVRVACSQWSGLVWHAISIYTRRQVSGYCIYEFSSGSFIVES